LADQSIIGGIIAAVAMMMAEMISAA